MQKRLGLDLEVSDEFGIGLAWYVTGEGHFGARISNRYKTGYKRAHRQLILNFQIGVRDDDGGGLEYIHKVLGVGRLHHRKARKQSKPALIYNVSAISDLYHVIVPLFEKYPLPKQWRKARDFEIWKQLVDLRFHKGGTYSIGWGKPIPIPQPFWDIAIPLIEELKRIRAYSPPSQSPV